MRDWERLEEAGKTDKLKVKTGKVSRRVIYKTKWKKTSSEDRNRTKRQKVIDEYLAGEHKTSKIAKKLRLDRGFVIKTVRYYEVFGVSFKSERPEKKVEKIRLIAEAAKD